MRLDSSWNSSCRDRDHHLTSQVSCRRRGVGCECIGASVAEPWHLAAPSGCIEANCSPAPRIRSLQRDRAAMTSRSSPADDGRSTEDRWIDLEDPRVTNRRKYKGCESKTTIVRWTSMNLAWMSGA